MMPQMQPYRLAAVLLAAAPLFAQDWMTPESLAQLRRVGELALSPDGRTLAFTVRTVDLAQNRSTPMVWTLDVAAGGSLPKSIGEGSEPCWAPDSKSVAFVTKAGIHVHALAGGPSRDLPRSGGVANLHWSPDGSRFSFTQDVKIDADAHDRYPDLPKGVARIYDDLMVRHWDSWKDGTYSHLFVMPANEDGKPLDLLLGEQLDTPLKPFGGKEQICWSPDGKEICYTAKRASAPERSTDSSLWVVSASGGAAECLTPGMPGYDQDPVWSPDGSKIAFCSMARAGFEADRVRLFIHDRSSKTNTEVLPQFDASVHDLQWTADGKALWFTVETQGTTQLYRCTLSDRSAVAVTKGRHQIDSIQVAPDGACVYALRASMERPPEVVRIDAKTGAVTALTDFNGAEYPQVEAARHRWRVV